MKNLKRSFFPSGIAFIFIFMTYMIKHEITSAEIVAYLLCAFFLPRFFLIFIALLTLLNLLFFQYFQREWHSSDIYNFFTHTDETFETFFALWQMFWLPLLTFVLLLWLISRKKNFLLPYSKTMLSVTMITALFVLPQLHIFPDLLLTKQYEKPASTRDESPLYPHYESIQNIILVIGESMKYDNYVQKKLEDMHLFYKKIYAGATNTDVSLPLLINAKNNPLQLTGHNETNLFRLAKKNGYHTFFISLQSPQALRYIDPYLQKEQIDHYRSFTKAQRKPKYDLYLLDALKKIDLHQKNFIVLQQIGEHSPYHYFPGKKSTSAQKNYLKSIDYSFQLYDKIISYLKKSQNDFILLYTSDHGEFTGENGRWGHNSFAPTIWEVPFFAVANHPLPEKTKMIASHYQLAQFLTYILGYHNQLEYNSTEKHIVNGTMITREDGYREIENNNSSRY